MDDRLHDLVFSDELPSGARRELVAALRQDPSLRKAFRQWRRVQQQLREEIDAHIPDRKLLVLYALGLSDDELLSPREKERVREARARLEAALEEHPGLRDVVRRIQAEKEAFDTVWEQHTRVRAAADGPATKLWSVAGRWQARAAAVVGLLVLTGMVYLWMMQAGSSLEHVETGPNEERSVELADGSVVHLEEQTRLAYAVSKSGARRFTRLDGTAFFEVAADDRAFVVETSTATARVLGTTFGVVSGSAETKITVAEGRVAFSPAEDTVRAVVVTSGQASYIAEDGSPMEPRSVDVSRELAWSGYLFFRDMKLREVAARLNSTYDQTVGIEDRLAEERVSGTFRRDQALDEILEVIATTLDASVARVPEGGYRLHVPHEQN